MHEAALLGQTCELLRLPSLPTCRHDAAEPDVVQAVLQAAFLRQLLGVPPAGSKHPVAVPASLSGVAAASSSNSGGNGEAGIDLQRALAESASLARSSLAPFISEVRL